jgi:Tfp pilus assembly protein PilE
MLLTTEIKAVIAAVIVAIIGYSYYWTYDQGRKNGTTSMLAEQVRVQTKALAEQDAEFRKTRQKEMEDARKAADDFQKYHKRMVGIYEQAIDNIKKQPKECVDRPVDAEYLSLRNSARGYDSPQG